MFCVYNSTHWIRQQRYQFKTHLIQGTDSKTVQSGVCPLSNIIASAAKKWEVRQPYK